VGDALLEVGGLEGELHLVIGLGGCLGQSLEFDAGEPQVGMERDDEAEPGRRTVDRSDDEFGIAGKQE
jgi:hypothetical protein